MRHGLSVHAIYPKSQSTGRYQLEYPKKTQSRFHVFMSLPVSLYAEDISFSQYLLIDRNYLVIRVSPVVFEVANDCDEGVKKYVEIGVDFRNNEAIIK